MTAPRMAVVTTAHAWGDPRVFERELATCLEWGVAVHVFVPLAGGASTQPRIRGGWGGHPNLTIHPLPMGRGRLGRLVLALRAGCQVLARGPWTLVQFHDPELIPVMALFGLLRPGSYTLCDLHEDLPLQVAAKPYLPPWIRPPMVRLVELMLRMARELFSGFAPATEAIARNWPADRTRVVHNYPKAVFAQALADPDPTRVLYVGGLSRARGILVVLEAVAAVRAWQVQHPSGALPMRLELVGWVLEPEVGAAIQAAVAEGWCRHIPWLTPEALAGHAAGAGIGLATLLPMPNYLEALPTKLFEYMAMGIPILASDFPLWRRLVAGAGAGQVTAPTPGAVAEALLRMGSDPAELAACARRGRAAYRDRYRWEVESRNLRWHLQQAGLLPPLEA